MSERLQRYLEGEIQRAATIGAGSPTEVDRPPTSGPKPARGTAPTPPQRAAGFALLLRQCECGVLLRVRYLTELKRYTYKCGQCAREIELIGEVLDILVCKVEPVSVSREWVKVPACRIIEST